LGTIDSTNDEALRRLEKEDLPIPCLIAARAQTQGRGRHRGRLWLGEEGNLFATCVTKMPEGMLMTHLSLFVACAVYRSVRSFIDSSVSLTVKWPNDVLLNDQKVAGILIETGPHDTVLIGIGVNIASAPVLSLPHQATCLKAFISHVTIEQYTSALMHALEALFKAWKNQGFSVILMEWQRCAQGLGQRISFRIGQGGVQGIFERLNPDGHLVLRLPNEEVRVITSGEVQ
jgi:BirA family biotin operon repressor/biotin-[acetyl-CoA-carboxylase] ligase